MKLSIIIPVFNEAENIGKLISYLKKFGYDNLVEIIVVDGGSSDDTMGSAANAGAVCILSPEKGRAAQMNFGAAMANGDVLYFVHADTLPPVTYISDLQKALLSGHDLGRYLSSYDSESWLLKINAFLSRFDTFGGMGGDQTLFITKKLFQQIGGFNGSMKIMEEFEFCARARKLGKYAIISKSVLISARKYTTNGWFSVQRANYQIVKMYQRGATQENMVLRYKQMLKSY